MSTSEARALAPNQAPASPLVNAATLKLLVVVNGLVPAALLLWDALHNALGVNDVNFAIRTTGLVGLVMLMLTLLVTPLRILTGWATLIAARRALGLLTFFYLATHFAIFFVFDRAASVSSTIEEILTRTYLQIGTVALVLMAALALTSTDRMVTALGPRGWKRLHRLVYVIAVLGVVHFLLLVKSDLRAPRAFAIALGALLLFRVVHHYLDLRRRAHRPVARERAARPRFWSGELVVARIFRETPDVKTFRLVPAAPGGLPFAHVAGQYLNLSLIIDGKRVSRSYTIASSPSRSAYVEITVKRAPSGYASRYLHDVVREGDRLAVSAPAGRFLFDGTAATSVVLLAGGVGITPLMSIVRQLTDNAWPGTIRLVVAMRTRADLIFGDELRQLAERFPNLHVHVTLSQPDDDWRGARGHVSAAFLREVAPELSASPPPILLCGPDAMMTATRAVLGELGVPPEAVATEAFVSPPAGREAVVELPVGLTADAAKDLVCQATFARSKKTLAVSSEVTLLEAAEDAGLSLPFECRSGLCGQCKVRLVRGTVSMSVQDALSDRDRASGYVLACQARATSDLSLDA